MGPGSPSSAGGPDGSVEYVVDGSQVATLEDFYAAVGVAVNGPGGYFGRNLDALRDCLSGGFGTPEQGGFGFVLTDSAGVRHRLGHAETARELARALDRVHPSNRPTFEARLTQARDGTGPTAYDWLVELFADSGVPLRLD